MASFSAHIVCSTALRFSINLKYAPLCLCATHNCRLRPFVQITYVLRSWTNKYASRNYIHICIWEIFLIAGMQKELCAYIWRIARNCTSHIHIFVSHMRSLFDTKCSSVHLHLILSVCLFILWPIVSYDYQLVDPLLWFGLPHALLLTYFVPSIGPPLTATISQSKSLRRLYTCMCI